MTATADDILATPAPALEAGPMIRFDPSQERFFRDESRVIVVNWHRQKGKDFTAAAKAVDHAINSGQNWYIVSITQRQADATFDKCKKVFEAYKRMLKLAGEASLSEYEYEEYDQWIDHHFVSKARELVLPNGARVVSLPGRDPDTLAGLTGNVIFTEFGLFPGGGYAHWRVVFPLATRGFRVIVISTPRGKNSKFFELNHDAETYSVHTCDLVQSVEQDGFILRDSHGAPCSIDEFKKLYGDPIGFEREYLCQFTGDLQSLITWAQLIEAGSKGEGKPFDYLRLNGEGGWETDWFKRRTIGPGRLELGWDVARTGHLSALWANHAAPKAPPYLRFLILMQGVPFEQQRTIVKAAMDAKGWGSGVGCGDATGLGMDTNETLERIYGDRWEGVNFSAKKSELGSTTLAAFRDGDVAIPPSDGRYKFIAADLYSVQRVTGSEGASEGGRGMAEDRGKKLKLTESENPLLPESHSDIAYANMLALRARSLRWRRQLPKAGRKPAGW